jgi:hypothetical protein
VPDTGLRSIDLRFLLPELPESVRLIGEPAGWRQGLAAAGIPVVNADAALTVVAAGRAAAPAGSPNVIVLGRLGSAALERQGYSTRVVLVRPRLFVPLDAPGACAHALLAPHPHRGEAKRLGARFALAALRRGMRVAPTAMVATRTRRPALLGAAAATGAPIGDDWCVLRGGGDDLQRLVWLCFDGAAPRTAVKFTRVPGNAAPFERDATAGVTLARLPNAVRGNVVHHYGRLRVGDLHGVAESAASGVPLQDLLETPSDPGDAVESIAQWIVELGAATKDPAGVFQHMDLGTWNVLVDGPRFIVVDWESSRRGEPLWDLAYFLTDALTARGPRDPEARLRAMLALHRGEARESERFFTWLDRAADTAGVDAIGPVVLRAWQHHARSHAERSDRARALQSEATAAADRGPLERLAGPWAEDPQLGLDWPAFRRWRSARSSC